MTVEELLEKYKRKYPGVPYEIYDDFSDFSIISKKNGKAHSYDDAPAIISQYNLGRRRRKIIQEEWYKEGELHKENDNPAIIASSGHKEWWYKGKLHRENDKPAVIMDTRRKLYFYNGKEYDPTDTPEKRKKQIEKLTSKKSSKQKQREDLLKEFVAEILN